MCEDALIENICPLIHLNAQHQGMISKLMEDYLPRALSCLVSALVVLAAASSSAAAQSSVGHDRPRTAKAAGLAPKPVLPKHAAPHWSSIAPDAGPVSRPEAMRTILFPRGGRLDVIHIPAKP